VTRAPNIEVALEELQDVLEQACRSSFTQMGTIGKALWHKPIPWWTSSLITQRNEVNAKRRRHQRMKLNSEIREQRKVQYLAAKAEYTANISREKSKSWKEFCNLTPVTNSWNAIYKTVAGKTKHATHT